METKDKRLADYLREVEAIHAWNTDPDTTRPINPRPNWQAMTRLEQQAFTMGHLSEFEAAGAKRIETLIASDIEAVRQRSPAAAAAYRDEIRGRDMQSQDRANDEVQFQKDRVVRRWHRQEVQRVAEREDQVWDRLGGKRMPPGSEKFVPERAQGGFGEYAKRETGVLERAREHMACRQKTDPSPER